MSLASLFFGGYFSLSFFPSFCLVIGPWCWTMAAPHTLCPNTLGSTRSSRLLPSLWVLRASVSNLELNLPMMTRFVKCNVCFLVCSPPAQLSQERVFTPQNRLWRQGQSSLTSLIWHSPTLWPRRSGLKTGKFEILSMSQSRKTGQEIYFKHFILFSKTIVSLFFLEVL